MPNRNAPSGLEPIDLQPQNTNRYYKSASVVLGIGDTVIRSADSSDPSGAYPSVTRATAGGAITGVVVGIEYKMDNLFKSGYLAAADTGYVLVADHPLQRFIAQDDGSAALSVANLGENINTIAAVDANSATGRSKLQLNASALGAGNTFALVGVVDSPDNDSTLVNCKWIVQPSLHTESNNSVQNVTSI